MRDRSINPLYHEWMLDLNMHVNLINRVFKLSFSYISVTQLILQLLNLLSATYIMCLRYLFTWLLLFYPPPPFFFFFLPPPSPLSSLIPVLISLYCIHHLITSSPFCIIFVKLSVSIKISNLLFLFL